MTNAAMQRRISAHLDAGITPSAKGNRILLKDMVHVKANGQHSLAAVEAERQAAQRGVNLDLAYWNTNRATDHRKNQIIAYDRSGQGI